MSPPIKIIHEQPNVENTIPLSVYQTSFPERFSLEDDDKFVIYSGARSVSLRILNNDPTVDVDVCSQLQNVDYSNISLFVLNTAFIIWFTGNGFGLEIPYQNIVLHAVQEATATTSTSLYLQLTSSEYITAQFKEESEYVPSIEVQINLTDDNTNANVNPLLNDSSIQSIYEALSKCSAFHYDSEDEEEPELSGESQPALDIPSSWLNQEHILRNSGDADDLELDENSQDHENYIAGMSVNIGFAPIAGSVRKRDEEEFVTNKRP